jgi:orotidine-5'-phosphate decarboxylase
MIAQKKLQKAQQTNRSFICLGLDLDPKKMPSDYSGNLKGMFEFAQRVIEATADQVCAYKPNLAFYESHGPDGLALLELIVQRIPNHIPVIIDGKRNDIGNTASQYASALFDRYRADWVTINPYMGYDSMRPFLERKDRGAFVLCLTSNAGSKDFQQLQVEGQPLYMVVADRVNYWNKDNNCGLVVGATHPEQLKEIRNRAGDMPLLIPGVGAQGGSLEKAITDSTDNFHKVAVVNVSRSVLYASNGEDFDQRARQELIKLNGIVTQLRYGDKSDKEEAGQPGAQPDRPDRHQTSAPPAPRPDGKEQPRQASQQQHDGQQDRHRQHSHQGPPPDQKPQQSDPQQQESHPPHDQSQPPNHRDQSGEAPRPEPMPSEAQPSSADESQATPKSEGSQSTIEPPPAPSQPSQPQSEVPNQPEAAEAPPSERPPDQHQG